MERFEPIAAARMTPDQRELAQFYRTGWRGQLGTGEDRLGGPLDAFMRCPELARRIAHLSDYFRTATSLDQRLNEFAILLAARRHDSDYEWAVHSKWAVRDGLRASIVQAVAKGERPAEMGADEAAAYDVLHQLSTTEAVSDEAFARAKSCLGEKQLLELVAVFGFYGMVAGVLALAQVGAPAATEPALVPRVDRNNGLEAS